MNIRIIAMLLIAAACMTVSAQTKPLWVQKGVKTMNNERSYKSYDFHMFTTYGADTSLLESERFKLLMEYVSKEYGTDIDGIKLDSLCSDGGSRTMYRLSFLSQDGKVSEVFAQLVDDWSRYEDNVDSWGFELHQLYAVSERNVQPQFDKFSLTDNYGIKPLFLSIIPGLGQIYKGQDAKGYAILGTEALLLAGGVYSVTEVGRYNRLAKKNPGVYDNYQSNATSYRQIRNACFIAGGALYIYNLIDAAISKGKRRVVIERQNNTGAEFAFSPVISECGGIGIGMSVKF